MNKILLAGFAISCLSASSSALIYNDYTASGSSSTEVYLSGINLSNSLYSTGLNFSLTGWTPSGYRVSDIAVGIYNLTVAGTSKDVLCVQLTADAQSGYYSYKTVSGNAGWLVSKIAEIRALGNTTYAKEKAAALAIATWEINYDSTDYGGTGLGLGTGTFKLTSGGNIATYAQEFLTNYDNDNTKRSYRYYHNPSDKRTSGTDFQDYIGAGGYGEQGEPSVPAPAAFIPFALGFIKAFRRKK